MSKDKMLTKAYGIAYVDGVRPGEFILAYFVQEQPDKQYQVFCTGDHSKHFAVVPFLRERLDKYQPVLIQTREQRPNDPIVVKRGPRIDAV